MASMSFTEDDFSCPVCCEIFEDPLLLLCSHSICKMCLEQFYERRGSRECPICRKESPQESPPLNLHLRNLCEIFKSKRDAISSLPNSELKPFSEVDKKIDSLHCQNSELHEAHIAKALKDELKDRLRPLQQTIDILNDTTTCNEAASNRKVLEQESIIKEEFEKLHQFLQDEEAARIAALRKIGDTKSNAAEDTKGLACQNTKPSSNPSTDSSVVTSSSGSKKFGAATSDSSRSFKFGGAPDSSFFGRLSIRDQFKKPKGSWVCGKCSAQNKVKHLQCGACQSKKPTTKPEPKGFRFGFSSKTPPSSGYVFGEPSPASSRYSPTSPLTFGGPLPNLYSFPYGGFMFGGTSSDSCREPVFGEKFCYSPTESGGFQLDYSKPSMMSNKFDVSQRTLRCISESAFPSVGGSSSDSNNTTSAGLLYAGLNSATTSGLNFGGTHSYTGSTPSSGSKFGGFTSDFLF